METIEKSYANKVGLAVLLLGAFSFIFHLWLSDYMVAALPLVVFRTLRDIVTALTVIPIFILGRRLAEKPNAKPIFTTILFVTGACMLTALVHEYYVKALPVEPVEEVTGALSPAARESSYILVKALLIGPITEEIVFRLAFVGVLSKFIGRFPSLLLSAFLFAIAHLTRVDLIGLPPYVFSGFLYGVTYLIFGLRWSIALHFAGNILSYSVKEGWYGLLLENNLYFIPFIIVVLTGLFVFAQQIFRHRSELVGGRRI